ncbi:hypothetical protein CH063_15374 [Colletotrichum higginsianum]|uniref:Uncharacterized protein n=1 Tax=Colletotrichum higginsianum (strain IMI 349063) TaxID=759273 RepID=H1W2I7_COLHI|nr:hypothetical protein CH063_15374 [Colletotrichum higginsianum]
MLHHPAVVRYHWQPLKTPVCVHSSESSLLLFSTQSCARDANFEIINTKTPANRAEIAAGEPPKVSKPADTARPKLY